MNSLTNLTTFGSTFYKVNARNSEIIDLPRSDAIQQNNTNNHTFQPTPMDICRFQSGTLTSRQHGKGGKSLVFSPGERRQASSHAVMPWRHGVVQPGAGNISLEMLFDVICCCWIWRIFSETSFCHLSSFPGKKQNKPIWEKHDNNGAEDCPLAGHGQLRRLSALHCKVGYGGMWWLFLLCFLFTGIEFFKEVPRVVFVSFFNRNSMKFSFQCFRGMI